MTVARPLQQAQLDRLESSNIFGRAAAKHHTDPQLIGGIRIQLVTKSLTPRFFTTERSEHKTGRLKPALENYN